MSEGLRNRSKNARETLSLSKERPGRRKEGHEVSSRWDHIFWLFAAIAVLYFTQFASHLIFNPSVKRSWLLLSMLCLCVLAGCMIYCIHHHPTLDTDNWHILAPVLIPSATIFALLGSISLCIAVWPVWHFFTLLIMPTLFMGFVSVVGLFNL